MMNQGGNGRTLQGQGRPGGGAGGRRGPGGIVGVLNVVSGNDRGKQYPLVNPQTQIGRGADQDFILADIAVSRRHVVIAIEGERYRLKDLGSGNGTLVNGVRTATSILVDGDQVEIGNTVLRFEHPPSAANAQAAPMAQAPAQQRTMIGEAQQYPPQQQGWGAPPPQANPYGQPDAMQFPPVQPAAGPTPVLTGAHQPVAQQQPSHAMPQVATPRAPSGGLLDSPIKKAAVFGGLGVVVILGGAITYKAVAGNSKEEAKQLFAQCVISFGQGDYDKAKSLCATAQLKDPTLADAARYMKQCDEETHARQLLAQAQKFGAGKQFDDEFKTLDKIDKSSRAWEDAEKLRKQAVPEAVKSYLSDARDAMADDKEAARTKIEAALSLDPDNSEAQDLSQKLKAATAAPAAPEAPAAAPAAEKPARVAATSRTKTAAHAAPAPAPAPARTAAQPKSSFVPPPSYDDDDDDGGSAKGAGGSDLSSIPAAWGPYRSKDFNGAANALRNAARSQKGAAQTKVNGLAAQVAKLADAYQKAERDKASNPVAAVTEYQQAATIDAQVGHSTHAAYFKSQAQKLAKDAAKQAFTQQRFDTAFEMAKTAQRLGGDDGGVQAQLKAKAAQMNNQAQAQARSNPNGAKTIWRMVLRMVPPGDPAYVAAQRGLAASAGAKDEDED